MSGPFGPLSPEEAREAAVLLRRLDEMEARLRAEYDLLGETYREPSFEDLEPLLRQMMFDAGVVCSQEQEDHVIDMMRRTYGRGGQNDL